jgi:hypothetical protein
MAKRRKASGTKKQVAVGVDPAAYKRLVKAADEFHAAVLAIAAVCVGGPKKTRKRRKPR